MFDLFPPHGLDQTIHVAVLVGLYVLLFTTEVFGWVWSGLVVPGYLASVFLIQPAAGVTIVFESVLTFAIARLLSDGLGRKPVPGDGPEVVDAGLLTRPTLQALIEEQREPEQEVAVEVGDARGHMFSPFGEIPVGERGNPNVHRTRQG